MPDAGRSYRYVGPAELLRPGREPAGVVVASHAALAAWLDGRGRDELAEQFTFTVSLEGDMLLAPRRSEHVGCAGGRAVLAAGEITFARSGQRWRAAAVSNHSTGYCPAPEPWAAAAAALDRAGIGRPAGYDPVIVFRRCPACRELNIVRDLDFACAICGGPLPAEWNIGPVPA